MKNKLFFAVAFLVVMYLFGCQDSMPTRVESEGPTHQAATLSLQQVMERGGTIEEVWSNLAGDPIPGFAGIYVNRQGLIVVSAKVMASEGLAVDFARGWRSMSHHQTAPIQFRLVLHDFSELRAWRDGFRELLGNGDVIHLDADEVENAVSVGVRAGGSKAEVRAFAERAGIPESALRIIDAELAVDDTDDLRDTIRPVIGGLEIRAEGKNPCSLGFNTLYAGDTAFVTNSHCSTTRVALDSGVFVQDAYGYEIGVEVLDREPWWGPMSWAYCWFSDPCRASDAQLSEYYDTVSTGHGRVARTTWVSTGQSAGSITIASPNYFNVAQKWMASSIYVGLDVDKVGRSTGWTRGEVTATCVDIDFGYVIKSCQMEADYYSEGGDSGSPVFVQLTGNHVGLAGLHHGRDTIYGERWFSSLDGIEYDLQITLEVIGDPLPVSVEIDGPEEVPPDTDCSWQSIVSHGTSPFEYQWWGVASGTDSYVDGALDESGYLWLAVTDSNEMTDTVSLYIDVDDEFDCDGG